MRRRKISADWRWFAGLLAVLPAGLCAPAIARSLPANRTIATPLSGPVEIARGTSPQADAAKAKQLSERAQKLSQNKTRTSAEAAIALYEEALQIWEAQGNRFEQVSVLLAIGATHYTLNQNEQTLQYAERALAISRSEPPFEQQQASEAFSLAMVGNAYLHLEDARQALERYQQAISLFEAIGLPNSAASVRSSVGNAYSRLGETQAAIAAYDRALAFYRERHNTAQQILLLKLLGIAHVTVGNTESARQVFLELAALQESAQNPLGQADAQRSLGLFHTSIGENRQALAAYEKAVALYDRAAQLSGHPPDPLAYIAALSGLGTAYFHNGRREEAFTILATALGRARDIGNDLLVAELLGTTGLLRKQLGETDRALALLTEALEFRRKLKQPVREAVTLRQIAALHFTLGEFQKTLDFYTRALQLQRDVKAKPDEAVTLTEIAHVYQDLGDFDLALETYDRALELFENIGDRGGEAEVYLQRGNIHAERENHRRALTEYTRSLALYREQEKALQVTTVLVSQARAYEALEQYPQALEAATAIFDLARDSGFVVTEGLAWAMQGRIQIAAGEPRKALEALSKALTIVSESGSHLGRVGVLENIGKAHQDLDELPQAAETYAQALALARAAGDRLGEAQAHYHLAKLERQRERLPAARSAIEAAIDIVESSRGTLVSPDLRASYLSTIYRYYEFYIDLLMEQHRRSPTEGFDALALHASERARARSLLDLLAEANADIKRGVDPQLLAQERSLQQRLHHNEKRRVELYNDPNISTAQARQLEAERQQLLGAYRGLADRIRATSPRYAALQYPEPLDLDAIQQQVLDGDTLLLQYSLGEERSYLWAVTPTTLQSYELPDRATIEAAAKTLRRRIRPQGTSQAAATRLGQMLLEPVAARLQANKQLKRIVVVGDGALQYIPFAALPAPGQQGAAEPLISRYEVVSLPSSTTLATLRQFDDSVPAPKTLAIFADPVFDASDSRLGERPPSAPAPEAAVARAHRRLARAAEHLQDGDRGGEDTRGWSRLPGTRAEAEAIGQLVPASDRLEKYGFDVNYLNVTDSDALSQYRLIHFATHGILDSTDPKLSGLVLSLVDEKGRPQNGYLRLHEIFNLELAAADLVVLSACQTGLGKTMRGEGVLGMTRGFMYAGAPRVVVSLWSVDDAATAALMAEFYRNMLQRDLPPAAALRAAQMVVRQDPRWAAPFYWAGFTLQGEWQW